MKELTTWLNSKRNFNEGVQLFAQLGNDPDQLQYFLLGATEAAKEKLFISLREIYYSFKKGTYDLHPDVKAARKDVSNPTPVHAILETPIHQIQHEIIHTQTTSVNTELESSCKNEADKIFKELMNIRARLFYQCSIEQSADENSAVAIAVRHPLAFEIIDLQPALHRAYEKLKYVQLHGQLPGNDADPDELPTNPIELERMRSNLLKNISRHKRDPNQTPERLQLIQKHELKLKRVIDVISKL